MVYAHGAELENGGLILPPDETGDILRMDERGNVVETRRIGDANWPEWATLFGYNPCIRVDYHTPDGERQVYIPVVLVRKHGTVKKAFAVSTGLPMKAIRFFNDEWYTSEGIKIEN